MSVTVLVEPAQLLTLADGPRDRPRAGAAQAELGLRTNHSVILDGERITWVGPKRSARERLARARSTAAARLSCRLWSTATRTWCGAAIARTSSSCASAAPTTSRSSRRAAGSSRACVRPGASTDDELLAQSRVRLERMRRSGATSFEVKSGYGLDLETELRQLRVARRLAEETGARVRTTCLAAHALPAELRDSPAGRVEFVRRVCEDILPAVAAAGLADFCDVFCDRGAFTPDETRQILLAARALGILPRLHANEFGHTGGALLAAELGALSADHLLHLDDAERGALRDAGVVATLLPGTSLVLGKPFADGRALVKAGVPVAVATDCNPGSCALESLAMVLALACYGCKLSPAEALCGATHNAACSLGLADEVGRIDVGMSADLLMLATGDYRDLVYHAGSPLISAVYQRGQQVA